MARLQSNRLLLAITSLIGFTLFQMDFRSAFFNGILNEEGCVEQPKGFEDPYNSSYVFELKEALHELNQKL